MATSDHVTFPFAQALPAARALWALADEIDGTVVPARQQAATVAIEWWDGVYRQQFDRRMSTSTASGHNVAADLRAAARNIAQAWADANHQEQTYRYYAMVKQKRDSRGELQQLWDGLFGDSTNYGSPPAAPAVPSPPNFDPTPVPQASVPSDQPAPPTQPPATRQVGVR